MGESFEDFDMRNVIDIRRPLESVPIEEIELDATSRDDIPALLIGLQAIYRNKKTRAELFTLLEAHILPDRRRDTGRPGMALWTVLVLGVLKQGLGCDYDRLREFANQHLAIRQMLGHGSLDRSRYDLQNIRDNVELMTPKLLREVDRLIVESGHKIAGRTSGDALAGRCDSFVVKTDVHYPTDFNLLRDSLRCLIRETARACGARGVCGWQQWEHHQRKVGRLYNRVRQPRKCASWPDEVRAYLAVAEAIADKAQASLEELRGGGGCPKAALDEIDRLLGHARRFSDQIDRRVLQEEKIPHGEKVFSIFEEHTRWISKGKAGTPFELGVPVSIVEDGNGFVLGHEIMWTGGDTDVAVPLVKRCQESFPDLRACSFDRGYHSPRNRERLDELLDLNGLPKKGKLSAAEREREADPAFAEARRKHSGVESAINTLGHCGLNRVRLRGADGFELAVGLSVLASNIQRIGQILREKERKRLLRRKRMLQNRRKRAA